MNQIKLTLLSVAMLSIFSLSAFPSDDQSAHAQQAQDPFNLQIAETGDGYVKLSWTHLEVNGSIPSTYGIEYGTNREYLTQVDDSNTNSKTISGLTNETEYFFKISLQSGVRSYMYSAMVPATPQAAPVDVPAAPGAATNVVATPGDGQVTVTWSPPTNVGSGIDRYQIVIFDTVTGTGGSATPAGDATSYILTGLTNDHRYALTLYAINVHGSSGAPDVHATPRAVVIPPPVVEEKKSGGGGSDQKWKTKPTFGKSLQTNKQLVSCGYSMDGICRDVMDYHVEYTRQTIHTNTAHDFTMKVYAQNGGAKWFKIGFGISEIGTPVNESEALIHVIVSRDYDSTSGYDIEEVIVTDPNNVIDFDSKNASVYMTKCMDDGTDARCVELSLHNVMFREQMYSEPFVIHAMDQQRRNISHYMNDGLLVVGESMNEPLVDTAGISKSSSQDKPTPIELVRVDKLNDLWEDQNGHTWTKNDHDT